MDNIGTNEMLLLFALIFCVAQAALGKRGIGKIEHLSDGVALLVLGILSIPLNLLSNIGLIIVTIWSFFVLDWVSAIIVVGIGFVLWSYILGSILVSLKRSGAWESIIISGIPLQLMNKFIASGCVVYLAWNYIN